MVLTEEERQRMEANRQKALQIRSEKLKLAEQQQQQMKNNPELSSLNSGTTFQPIQALPPAPGSVATRNPTTNHHPSHSFQQQVPNKCDFSAPSFGASVPKPRPAITGASLEHSVSAPSSTSNSSAVAPPLAPIFRKNLQIACSLIGRNRFEVHAGYDKDLIEFFKTMRSRQYVKKAKETFKDLLTIDELPELIKSVFAAGFKGNMPELRIPEIDLSPIDAYLRENIFPFQREGIRFAISKNGRALIADDMGLGKTVQAIGVASYYLDEWPILIVCPSSMRFTWSTDLLHWLPSQLCEEDIFVVTSARDELPTLSRQKSVIITSYDMMVVLDLEFVSRKFKIVILDESHLVKSYNAKRTQTATRICKSAKRLLLLTGTPSPSRPSELFSQIHLIRKDIFRGGFKQFAYRYCEGKQTRFGFEANGAANMDELQIFLKETVMIRRVKSEVLKELPDKLRRMVILDKGSVKTNLKQMQEARKELEKQIETNGSEKHGALLKFFTETAHAKVDAVTKFISEAVESTPKLLVFAHHRVVMDSISMELAKSKVKTIRIDGNTSAKDRTSFVAQFQDDPDTKVALLSITAANTGLTLTAASTVIFAELFWNPGTLVQAEDRAHRVGQKTVVVAQYLVATGTADDYLWALVNKKQTVLHQVGLSKDNFKDSETTVVKDTPGSRRTAVHRIKNNHNIMEYLESVQTEQPTDDEEQNPPAKKRKRV